MKIVRWIIIIIAAISVVGVGFGLLIGNADSTNSLNRVAFCEFTSIID